MCRFRVERRNTKHIRNQEQIDEQAGFPTERSKNIEREASGARLVLERKKGWN